MSLPMLHRRPDSGLGNIRSSPGDPSRNIDWILLVAQILLTVAGCFVVYSATRTDPDIDPYLFVTRQVVFAIVAAVVMFVVMSIDYELLRERARAVYGITVLALLALLVLGKTGAAGSFADDIAFTLGPINVQPAEFAKLAVLLMLAAYIADEGLDSVSYPRFVGSLLIVGLPTVLIIAQPDLGTASVVISSVMGVLLIAGAKLRYIVAVSMMSLLTVMAAFISGLVNSYQLERFRVLFDQDNPDLRNQALQVTNAIRAVGTGGVFGKGWLKGDLTNGGDIPVAWADFPFAAIGEQFGMVGCGALLGLFIVVLFRIWRIAHLSKDLFGTYLCAGVFTMMMWQLFQNIGMTIGILPVTGLPMPFISYGGSGLVTYFALMGIVQSVHMRRMR
ncbi:MAG: rod shape-determining protein RodA [Actinomycetota bacterium]|nr:rod shape-determining protein RodA [Actinomycetota bacterium]